MSHRIYLYPKPMSLRIYLYPKPTSLRIYLYQLYQAVNTQEIQFILFIFSSFFVVIFLVRFCLNKITQVGNSLPGALYIPATGQRACPVQFQNHQKLNRYECQSPVRFLLKTRQLTDQKGNKNFGFLVLLHSIL